MTESIAHLDDDFAPSLDEEAYSQRVTARASDKFYGDIVSLYKLRVALSRVKEGGAELDLIKKAFFYGAKANDVPFGGYDEAAGCQRLPEVMDINILHAVIGVITEAAEIAEALLKSLPVDWDSPDAAAQGKPFDLVNLQEEFGDINWYRVLGLNNMEQTEGQNRFQNDAKLEKRFGKVFSEDRANNRDLEGERAVLEGAPPTKPAPEMNEMSSSEVEFRQTMDKMGAQSREFTAADAFSKALAAHNMTAVVDDDYPEVRHRYESALADLIRAMTANGRFDEANRYGLMKIIDLSEHTHRIAQEASLTVERFLVGTRVQIHGGAHYGHNGIVNEVYRNDEYQVQVVTGPAAGQVYVARHSDLKPE